MQPIHLWNDNPSMDKPIGIDALRKKLKAMTRPEALKLAEEAGVPPSTLEKFRGGHVTTPGAWTFQALIAALAGEKPPPKPRKKARQSVEQA